MGKAQASASVPVWSVLRGAPLAHGDVEATLSPFVFHVAQTVGAQVSQHLAEHPLEGVVGYCSPFRALWRRHGRVAVVGDVEGGAVAVAALLAGVTVAAAQPSHVVLGAQHARHDDAVQRDATHIQAVEETSPDVAQQVVGSWHQVRDAVRHVLVDAEVRVGGHIHQLALAVLGLLAVGHGCHTPLLGGQYLHVLHVGEAFTIGMYVPQFVPSHILPIGISVRRARSTLLMQHGLRRSRVGFCGTDICSIGLRRGRPGHDTGVACPYHREHAHKRATQCQVYFLL